MKQTSEVQSKIDMSIQQFNRLYVENTAEVIASVLRIHARNGSATHAEEKTPRLQSVIRIKSRSFELTYLSGFVGVAFRLWIRWLPALG